MCNRTGFVGETGDIYMCVCVCVCVFVYGCTCDCVYVLFTHRRVEEDSTFRTKDDDKFTLDRMYEFPSLRK